MHKAALIGIGLLSLNKAWCNGERRSRSRPNSARSALFHARCSRAQRPRRQVGRHRDAAMAAHGAMRSRCRVVAGVLHQSIAAERTQPGRTGQVAAGVLDGRDQAVFEQAGDGFVGNGHPGPTGNVVQDHGTVCRVRHGTDMGDDAVLSGFRVRRRCTEQRAGAASCRSHRDGCGVVRSRCGIPCDNGNPSQPRLRRPQPRLAPAPVLRGLRPLRCCRKPTAPRCRAGFAGHTTPRASLHPVALS